MWQRSCVVAVLLGVLGNGISTASPARLGPEFEVNTFTTGSQGFPHVAVSDSGAFVIVWQSTDQDGSGAGIFARHFDSDGNPLDPSEFQVNSYTTGDQTSPQVATTPEGDFVIVWDSDGQDGSLRGVFARQFDSNGNALNVGDIQVNAYTTGMQRRPNIGISDAGDFTVTWTSTGQDGSGYGVFARSFDSSGIALSSVEFQVNTHTLSNQMASAITVAAGGEFVVFWNDWILDGSSLGVFARRFDSTGIPLDPVEFQVNTYTPNSQTAPSAAIAPSGDFVVVWTDASLDGSFEGCFGRRFGSSGQPLDAAEFQINTYTSLAELVPSVGMSDIGTFVVVWEERREPGVDKADVAGRRFDFRSGPLDSEAFIVNTYTPDGQLRPMVAMDPDGGFTVAWQDRARDGSGEGVFAQRFCGDRDVDDICDDDDIVITSPADGDSLDCRTPGMAATRPTITWQRGKYDRFRAMISWKPDFPRKNRIDTGKDLIRRDSWTPGRKAWKRACSHGATGLYIRVFGVDRGAGANDPARKTRSSDAQVSTLQ